MKTTTLKAILLALASSVLAWPLTTWSDWSGFDDWFGYYAGVPIWTGAALAGAAFGLLVLVHLPVAGARSLRKAAVLVCGSALIYLLVMWLALKGWFVFDFDGIDFSPSAAFVYSSVTTSGLGGAILVATLVRVVLGAPAFRRGLLWVAVAGLLGGAIFSVLQEQMRHDEGGSIITIILYGLAHAAWQVPLCLVLRRSWLNGA